MVLRITQVEGSDAGAVLRLEGRVVAEWASLLEQACTDLFAQRDEVRLDLAGVSFIDQAGVEALRRLSRAGAEILCTSGPVASVLEGVGIHVTLDSQGEDDGRP